jgi:hypothetical protein
MKDLLDIFDRFIRFYTEGFKTMSGWGRKAWLIIIIKLFIMFAVLRLFFFPDFLNRKFDNSTDKGAYVRDQIINYQVNND